MSREIRLEAGTGDKLNKLYNIILNKLYTVRTDHRYIGNYDIDYHVYHCSSVGIEHRSSNSKVVG